MKRAAAVIAVFTLCTACVVSSRSDISPGGAQGRLTLWQERGGTRSLDVELVDLRPDALLVMRSDRLAIVPLAHVRSFHARRLGITVFVTGSAGATPRSLEQLRRMTRFPFGMTAAQYATVLDEARQAAPDTIAR